MSDITKKVIDAVTEAFAGSLFVRALLENQLDISKVRKLRIDELEDITDKIMVIETEKYQVLLNILSNGSESVSQLINDLKLSEFKIMS
ncbi:MAG: hypothetical protein ACFFD2_21265, partial [Promethearchaeota archaeon]